MTRAISVGTGFDPRYLFESITQDISSAESIFDLVDNSIDSIRAALILQEASKTDDLGMPKTYRGFHVHVVVAAGGIRVSDDGTGLSRAELEHGLLVVGRRAGGMGNIGKYGIGLKRALLKLGGEYSVSTTVEGDPYEARFESADLTAAGEAVFARPAAHEWPLTTSVRIEQLTQAARNELIATSDMPDLLRRQVGYRYGRFIAKGLSITVNGRRAANLLPAFRGAGSPVLARTHSLDSTSADVTIQAQTGTHAEFRFTGEGRGTANTSEFGWYVACNDRVVRIADRSPALGFPSTWHGEYNGFVGLLLLVGDSRDLPWNTKKTDIDESSDLIRSLQEQLKEISSVYRGANRALRKSGGATSQGRTGKDDAGTASTASGDETRGSTSGPSQERGSDGSAAAFPQAFLEAVRLPNFSVRIQKILEEGQRLQMDEDGNLCAVLLRVLVDLCTADFYERKEWRRGRSNDLKLRINGVLREISPAQTEALDGRLARIRHDVQNGGLLDHTTLHGFVHAPDLQPTTYDLRLLSKGWGDYLQAANDHLGAH